jgi:hypothetical protein
MPALGAAKSVMNEGNKPNDETLLHHPVAAQQSFRTTLPVAVGSGARR